MLVVLVAGRTEECGREMDGETTAGATCVAY
jgi:hypothetical protein